MARKKDKTAIHYVDNEKFTEAVTEFADATRAVIEFNENEKDESKHKDLPQMSNYIGSCVLKIAQRLATAPNFVNYSYREEMISDGVENVFLYLKNFDASKAIKAKKKPNAFAYVTQIVYFAFLRRIEKEKKQQYIKNKSIEHAGIYSEISSLQSHDVGSNYINQFLDKIQNNMEYTYEPKTAAKKKKDKKKRGRKKGTKVKKGDTASLDKCLK